MGSEGTREGEEEGMSFWKSGFSRKKKKIHHLDDILQRISLACETEEKKSPKQLENLERKEPTNSKYH